MAFPAAPIDGQVYATGGVTYIFSSSKNAWQIQTFDTVDAAGALTSIKTVDGSSSGLDADLLDGLTSSQFLRSDANDSKSGELVLNGQLTVNTAGGGNQIRLYTETNSAQIGDTFAAATHKNYIYFDCGTSSNDPGFIMHETSSSETNEGIIHLCPTDDNTGTDYVSIHGTNDADSVRIYTDGTFTGVSTINGISPSSLLQTTNGAVNLPTGSADPASTTVGAIYYNTTEESIKQYTASEGWRAVYTPPLGSVSNPAQSATAIINAGDSTGDGVYWIDLPTVGPTQIYCIMDTAVAGGGWMLAMRAAQGTTFGYSSSYWTSANTLNAGTVDRSNADAKYDVFNHYAGTQYVAFFPDLNNGGQTSGFGTGWHWLHSQASAQTCLSRFQTTEQLSGNPRGESMYVGSGFSNQLGMQWYGFNYTLNSANMCRWGFGWNNENDHASNDVTSGIGLVRSGDSAGDRIYCCAGTTGVDRAVRMEIWVK